MADNITVGIEHRAEGYLLRVGLPESVLQGLANDTSLGSWREALTDFVPLSDLPQSEDFDRPELVRIEIDVLPDH